MEGSKEGEVWRGSSVTLSTIKKNVLSVRGLLQLTGVLIYSVLTDMSVMLVRPVVLLKRQGHCSWYGVTANWVTAWKKGHIVNLEIERLK